MGKCLEASKLINSEKDFSEEADGDEEGKDKVNYSAQIHILDKTTVSAANYLL